MVSTNTFDAAFAFANAITIQPQDGKVLITGAGAYPGTTGNDMVVVRYGNEIDADRGGISFLEVVIVEASDDGRFAC